MTNPLNDVRCTFEIVSNSAVAFYFDLIEHPSLKDVDAFTDGLEEIMNRHANARHADFYYQGELLTVIVYGTVNPVTIWKAEQEK